jgi:ornithine carbamoyltransferase
VIEEAETMAKSSGSVIVITSDIASSVEDADYLYTDVWISMGQEKETAKRKKDLADFKISSKLMKKSPAHCKVMHCLPAHRGEEIDSDVIDSSSSIVFEQAENRLHLQKALLCTLMQ